MTDLRQLLAFNLKQKRCELGITQAKLAEKADVSTQYIAMIEIGRKFPSLEMLERLAIALKIDILDFFSPPPFSAESLKKLQKTILASLEKEITKSINKAVQKTVTTVVASYTMDKN
jgi:transcriptional regulator with XRE-family HTH domain